MILANNTDKKGDTLIFPILYCIDHSIELFAKAIIRELEELASTETSNCKSHYINNLLKIMVSKIKDKEGKTAGLERHLNPVTLFVNELYGQIE